MSNQGNSSGATGFLFGNIDRQGRLDAGYLSDEAKDNLDQIGTKVTDKDAELDKIRVAVPGYQKPLQQPQHLQSSKQQDEMYEESDGEIDLDENERALLAQRAIENANKASNPSNGDGDDEDYDADDDEDDDNNNNDNNPDPTAVIPIVPSTITPVKPSPPTQSKAEVTASVLQEKLLHEARQSKTISHQPSPSPILEKGDDEPLLFSNLFARPPRRLNFTKPPRHTYGVKAVTTDIPSPCIDDSERLLTRKTPQHIDPITQALEADNKNRQLLHPSLPQIRPRILKRTVLPTDYEQASAPLCKYLPLNNDDKVVNTENNIEPAPFQLVSWEDNIVWKDDDNDDSSSNWYSEHMANKQFDQRSADRDVVSEPMKITNDDNSDDDDDEFEDPVELNPSTKPTAITTGESDDEDDMEWEDGDIPASNNMGTNENKSTQGSISELPSDLTSSQVEKQSKDRRANRKSTESNRQNISNGPSKDFCSPSKRLAIPKSVALPKESGAGGNLLTDISARPKVIDEGREIVEKVIEPNKEIASGTWVHGIMWSSDEDSKLDDNDTDGECEIENQLCRLILDMNDPNMIFECLPDRPNNIEQEIDKQKSIHDLAMSKEKMASLYSSTGSHLHQTLQDDTFNTSNDLYYANSAAHHFKLERGPSVRRLQDAQPAMRIQTAPNLKEDSDLLSYHRPKLQRNKLPRNMTIHALRRKRVKGGNAQIAGQIPKHKSDLRCSEKDAYRICIFEYTMERQPCLLPIPGMASRIRTYARKESAVEVQRADQAAAGTPNADTVFMGPDEPPPLACGNIEANEKPLSVIESQLFVAPCAKHDANDTDFLLVRHGKSMYVREIDSLMSLGLTEPKFDVMTPNTERYKKYGRERVYLWVMREFQRMRKEIDKKSEKRKKGYDYDPKSFRSPPYLEKEEVFHEFPRRRTYPETALNRALKDFGKFQNGRYVQNEEIISQYGNKEQEIMRILTPIETAAFESMECGWAHILERGVVAFTFPSQQGNILQAAESERTGLDSGRAVGKYIKSLLLKSPWYRSVNIRIAHRSLHKDLFQALSLARIVNDLKEGGDVMEAKLQRISSTDMTNVLTTVFKYNSKKIPVGTDERKALLREFCQKKGKGAPSAEYSDYPTIIRDVIKKHRDAGYSKGAAIAAMGTSMAGGSFLGVPLQIQRKALEEGDVSELPAEEDDFVPDENALKYVTEYERSHLNRQVKNDESSDKRTMKKGRPLSANTGHKGNTDGTGGNDRKGNSSEGGNQSRSLGHGHGHGHGFDGKKDKGSSSGGNGSLKTKGGEGTKKKILKLKVTRTVIENGQKVRRPEIITDPKEIEKHQKKKQMKAEEEERRKAMMGNEPSASGGLKINIDMKKLGSAGLKKKSEPSTSEKPRSKLKSNEGKIDHGKDGEGKQKKSSDKKTGQVGKIKINTKQLTRDKEQAALKRKRSQYSDDIDYRAKKAPKTSRKKRNGTVELNGILERIENIVRTSNGFVEPVDPLLKLPIKILRLKSGESPPVGVTAKNLATPAGTGLDFTAPVDVPSYKEIVKKPMYMNLIRATCKQMKYKKASEFLEDMNLIVTNARVFNQAPGVNWVVQHAELLYDAAVEQVSRQADEIKMAEDMVAMEKLDTKGSGAGSSKKKLKKSKGSASEKKKKSVKETIIIPDDDITGVPPTNEGAGLSDDMYDMNPLSEDNGRDGPSINGTGMNSDVVLNLDD